ncbi:MAG: ribbon-helix-helix domain-containing protein [bacterium]
MPLDRRVTVKIPRPLYERLKEIIQGTGFSSVNEFIIYVMRDIASAGKLEGGVGLSQREAELIHKRLVALGYLSDK